MKFLVALALLIPVYGQTPPPAPLAAATRMSQLMESTAVAVPGLVKASEPVRQLAEASVASLRAMPGNAAVTYRFINQVKAYLALSDSFPASDMPAIAIQQLGDLRESLALYQQRFEADLSSQVRTAAETDADPNDLKHYAAADAKLPALGAVPRVVFLGDSLTENWRLNEYFSGRDFLNRGIGGQTTGQVLGRFLQDVAQAHPRAVVIEAGTNDLARGMSPGAIEDTLTLLGDVAKAHGVKPIFASIPPVSDYHAGADARFERTKSRPMEAIVQINRWIAEYCRKEGFVYLDYFTALVDAKGQLSADLSDDGLHPNEKGYRVMSPVALEAITRALAGVAPAAADPQTRKRFALPAITKKSESPTP